jgi:hypothetical protein
MGGDVDTLYLRAIEQYAIEIVRMVYTKLDPG